MRDTGGRNEKSSWEVSFAQSGVPLRIEPSDQSVTQPVLSYVKKSTANYSLLTRNIDGSQGANAHLTDYGTQLMRLLTWPD
jgi:hypothetical protein